MLLLLLKSFDDLIDVVLLKSFDDLTDVVLLKSFDDLTDVVLLKSFDDSIDVVLLWQCKILGSPEKKLFRNLDQRFSIWGTCTPGDTKETQGGTQSA